MLGAHVDIAGLTVLECFHANPTNMLITMSAKKVITALLLV